MTERLIYGARSLAEQRRNQARLGARWQENTTPERPLIRLTRYPPPLTPEGALRTAWWQGFCAAWWWK